MKDPHDTKTVDALDKPRRGRPPTGKALSRAEIQRRYRDRQKAKDAGSLCAFTRDELLRVAAEYQRLIDLLHREVHMLEQERNAASAENRRLRDQLERLEVSASLSTSGGRTRPQPHE